MSALLDRRLLDYFGLPVPAATAAECSFRTERRSYPKNYDAAADRFATTWAEAARELIKLRLADSAVDIDGAAKLLGMGTRKLQRQLAQENFTYRELVEQTRMGRALDLICESSQPITSIALSLGYSDIASFTRAFQRWTGFPPSRYRALFV